MKKNLIYLLSAIVVFASCSPAYKTSQTPDDVYYSPAKKIYVADVTDRYESYPSSEDEYLRMKVKDHDKWAAIDDYNYWYDSRYYANNYYSPYSSSFSLGIGIGSWGYGSLYPYSVYNTYWYNPWGSWYNPCYTVVYYKNPTVYYKPVSKYNLSTYGNRNYNNNNMPLQTGMRSNAYRNNNYYNTSNSNLNGTKNSYYNSDRSNNSSTPVRTFNNSGSSMSSGGGSRISGGGSRTRP